MKVAVIGASGGMGSFFVRFFLARGDSVRGSDLRPPKGAPKGFVFSKKSSEAVRGCDLTILAVPMDKTVKAAADIAKSLKRGSVLVEIGSVKGGTLSSLRKLIGNEVKLLSIHPLFGPALESTAGMKVAVISEEGEEPKLAAKLFPEATIIPMGRKEHDQAMAVVLSLTHMLNIVYAGTVAKFMSPGEFARVSTPNSSMQLTLAEAVLAQDPRLSFAIQSGNKYTRKVARAALRELKLVLEMVEESDWNSFVANFTKLAKGYKTDKRASAVIREIYSAAQKTG